MDLSGHEELRELAATIRILKDVLRSHGTEWVIIGATARDLILRYGHRIDTWRATNDVDLAIAVGSWKTYEAIRNDLIEEGVPPGRRPHNFRVGQSQLDLIPFGNIAESDEIVWPSTERSMSVLGLEEAYGHAIEVRLEPGLDVPVATIPALAILKIIAWADRRHERPRVDGVDLRLMMATYGDWNEHRLFDSDIDVLERHDYDRDLAGAALLGRDMGQIAKPATKGSVIKIMERERASASLAHEMGSDPDRNLSWLQAALDEFRSGEK